MKSLLTILLLTFSSGLLAHGGIPPVTVPNYPAVIVDPVTPNRLPFCEEPGANTPCGNTSSCIVSEAPQALDPGQNVYFPGQVFEVPWLLSVTHGDGNVIDVVLRNVASGQQTLLISDFPQGDGLDDGEVIIIGALQIPESFPLGQTVIEVGQDTGTIYYDCADLFLAPDPDVIFNSGFD